jgi:DNA-binding Xre family transcriptional regulator
MRIGEGELLASYIFIASIMFFVCYNHVIVAGEIEIIGGRLKRLRRQQALGQQDLERMTGVTQSTISRLETNERPARPSTIRKLAEALGVEPKELMRGD